MHHTSLDLVSALHVGVLCKQAEQHEPDKSYCLRQLEGLPALTKNTESPKVTAPVSTPDA